MVLKASQRWQAGGSTLNLAHLLNILIIILINMLISISILMTISITMSISISINISTNIINIDYQSSPPSIACNIPQTQGERRLLNMILGSSQSMGKMTDNFEERKYKQIQIQIQIQIQTPVSSKERKRHPGKYAAQCSNLDILHITIILHVVQR